MAEKEVSSVGIGNMKRLYDRQITLGPVLIKEDPKYYSFLYRNLMVFYIFDIIQKNSFC